MKTKSIAVILIISVFLIFLPACKDSKKDAKKEDANTQFVPQIYENSSIFASISNMGEGYDEVYKILYLEEDDNYYISLYDLHQLRERIDVYDQNFEYIKTIKGDIGELNPDIATLFAFDINENGDIYLMEYPDSDTAKNRLLLVFDKEGNLKEKIKIDDAKDILYSAAISDLFVEENRFVFVSPWGIQITDRAGKTIKEITNADKSRYVLSTDSDKNGFLYFSCSGSGELKKIDVSDGKEIWSIRSENGESLNRISYSREDGQICAYKTNTLSLYDINGNFLGDICDLRDFEPNLDNIDIQNYGSGMLYSLFYKNNKNIVFAFQAISQSENIIFVDTVKLEAINEEEAAKILEEREEQKDLKKTIKILLPYYDGLSENLIYDYNQSNPGIIIETLYFVEDPALYSPLDYVQYVAMRINAGDDDWDIVYDAFLPYDIYVAKGYFVELDALDTDHIFKDSERYYTNIIDALRDKNGKLYLFPSQINFYIFESLKEPLEVEFSSWREITSKKDLKFYDLGLNT
ncbi:MAG: hypothetical protein FWH48_08735, partial [Oscillospiraceae bacterium]|nr:hypothetical protein [Oscillospiraceae bacterium]